MTMHARERAAAIGLAFGIALGAVVAAAGAGRIRLPRVPLPQEVIAMSLFVGLLVAVSACLGVGLVDLRCDWLQVTALATAFAGLLVVTQAGIVGSPDTPYELLGVVAYAAWIEELIFRRLLPRALTRALQPPGRRVLPIAVVASQLVFAAAHFVAGVQIRSALDLVALTRLFAGGLLFAAVVARCGLAIGVLLHAELNLRALLPQPPPEMPSTLGVCLIAALAVGVTLTQASSLRQTITPARSI